MRFPTLYKKTSTGAIQFWTIEAMDECNLTGGYPGILTKYGQLGTDSPQLTADTIKKGKNTGKANETTAFEQAKAEAQAKWEKQKKKGYVESKEAAEKGEVDDLIEGGVLPMLAHTFEKQGKKIKYPCYVQPKLDGLRMIAILKDGKCTLWSRTRKPITSLPHIVAEIEKHFIADISLDGEAYAHSFKDNFEHIVHLVRQEEPDPQCTDVEFHIYDMVNDKTFEKRTDHLFKAFTIGSPKLKYLKRVETKFVANESEVPDFYTEYKNQGYEGCMLRNADGLYVGKRSSDLIKVKEFSDSEFKIIGISEGRGKLVGHVGAFICVTENGTEFLAKLSGDISKLREYFEDHSLWKNKLLTVQYQDLTGANKVPRFPVGLRIRKSE
jgi:DNA ligase-1